MVPNVWEYSFIFEGGQFWGGAVDLETLSRIRQESILYSITSALNKKMLIIVNNHIV